MSKALRLYIALFLLTLAIFGCTQSVGGAHGPIVVRDTMFADWTDTTSVERTLGMWDPSLREIVVDRRVNRFQRTLTIGHERCHASISDARLVLPDSTEEVLCDAIAAGFRR